MKRAASSGCQRPMASSTFRRVCAGHSRKRRTAAASGHNRRIGLSSPVMSRSGVRFPVPALSHSDQRKRRLSTPPTCGHGAPTAYELRMFEDADLPRLAVSWQRHLTAANRSPKTIRTYLDAVRQLVAYCAEHDRPTRPTSRRSSATCWTRGCRRRPRPVTAGCSSGSAGWRTRRRSTARRWRRCSRHR